MAITREHREAVTDYYTRTHTFYQVFWHGNALGLHYGLWQPGVRNRRDAIVKENQVLAGLANVKREDLVLDAGCGIGGSGIWMANEIGSKVIGLNIVPRQLSYAARLAQERNLEDQLSFVRGDYQQLPFQDNKFDVFWALESIEHSTAPKSLTTEAFRVLKPDGRIVLAGTFKGRDSLTIAEQRKLDVGFGVAGCFNDFKTAPEMEAIMEAAGFSDIATHDVTDQIMPSAKRMALMCKLGLPAAKVLAALCLTSPILIANNQWGIYQEELFKSQATSYNILVARKA